MNKIELPKFYVASLSGGKDSLYMFAHILNNLDKYPLDAVVHFELETDYPWVKNVIDYVESKCKILGIPLYRLKPRKSWEELYIKYGYPSRVNRWCNFKYKLDGKKQIEQLFKNKANVVYYIGLCRNEEKRIKKDSNVIYPLYELGIYENTIWEWARNQPIFNEFYKYNRRQGCMGCPLTSLSNTKYDSVFYPNEYVKYMNLALKSEKEDSEKLGRPMSKWQSNPKYNTEYRMKRIDEIELKEITRF